MEHALAGIAITTFVKDLVELGRKIKDSIDQVGENKEQLSKLRDEVTGTLDGLTRLAQGFSLNTQPSLELLTALDDLKSHLESVHNKCNKASQHPSLFKSWWNRDKIDREIKRLQDLKKDCHDQFALFSTARTEGKVDRIADTTIRIESAAVRLADTTARIEGSMTQFTGVIARIKDSTSRIDQGTTQVTGTTARTEGTVIQIADTTAQITDTTTRIERSTIGVACTTARIEGSTALLVDTTSRIEHTANEVEVMGLQQKLERWLEYPPNMKRRQDDTQELQHKGTGAWFLGGNQFKGWKEKPGWLWIQGDSGTGKSVLSSTVIRCLFNQRQQGAAVAYFYFDFRDEKSQRVKMMLQSIILQLSAQSPNSYSALEKEYESSQGQILPPYDNLLRILNDLLSDFTHIYIVLDALDECNEHDDLVQFITQLWGWTTLPLHLLFASQPREIFTEAFKHVSLVTLTPDITHEDIRRFIDSELLPLSHLTRRMGANEIVEKVVKKSNGMFRLAALLLMELRDAFNPDLHAILTSFPDNLFGVYSRFLQRIHPTAVFYVSAVLRWLTFSSEPVTMACLEDALAFNFSNPSEFVYDLARRGENADRVCKMLEGLIVVNQEWDFWEGENTRTVTLAHASVEDYIRSEKFALEYPGYDLRAGHSHRFLAQTCLGYLLQFVDHPLTREIRTHYPLGPYAAQYWYYHLHQSDNHALLSSLVLRLLQDGSNQYAAFNNFRLDFQIMFPGMFQCTPTKPLSVCSAIGSTEAVHFLLRNGADPNTNDNGSTALQAASSHGHLDIVRILLQSGAKVDVVALKEACMHVRRDIFEVLLQESSLSIAYKWITDELVIACISRHLEIGRFGVNSLEGVGILLETWINLGGAQVPHHLVVSASERGRSDIVRLLLEHGADVNAATEEYNALGAALLHGCVDTVRVLLEKGAEVKTSGIYGSALQVASRWGDIETVQLLVEHGAEVNATSGIYGSALQVASRWGDIETVRLLVEHGAEVNTAGGEYGSPLLAASRGGNVEMVQLLLEKGAQVNTAGGRYGSALQAASIRGRVGSVQLLLEHGADVNATGGMHGSALQAASRNGHVDIVRLLLENDADVNAIGGSSGTALKAAARLDQLGEKNWWDAKEITRILLENGAHEENMTYGSEEDVDAHDYSSDTGSWSNAAVVSDDEDAMLIFG